MNSSKLVVVLGMHRSGTSAIARGLEVLGVKLGDNLYPAAIDNPKGFWEDRDFLSINEELLAHLGSANDRLGLIDWRIPDLPTFTTLRLKAEKLVGERCDQNDLWGFKDPRTARLLPFWQSVLEQVGCDVCYVIATRNPISIVESLHRRSGFEPEKTFYLWLEHLIPSILASAAAKRVVVDYDRLLENPGPELLRVARALELPAPMPLALAAYENEFLDRGLRHTLFTSSDLESFPFVPSQVIAGYNWLEKLATDNVVPEGLEIEQAFESLSRDLVALSPAFNLINRQEQKIVAFSQSEAQCGKSIVALQAQVQDALAGNTWLTSQRDAWELLATQREQAITALHAQVQDLLTENLLLTTRSHETDERLELQDAMLSKIRSHKGMRFVNSLLKKELF